MCAIVNSLVTIIKENKESGLGNLKCSVALERQYFHGQLMLQATVVTNYSGMYPQWDKRYSISALNLQEALTYWHVIISSCQ